MNDFRIFAEDKPPDPPPGPLAAQKPMLYEWNSKENKYEKLHQSYPDIPENKYPPGKFDGQIIEIYRT